MTDELEIWKKIPSCKGYAVSTFGRVRSLPRISENSGRRMRGKLMTPTVSKKDGCPVHRLKARIGSGQMIAVGSIQWTLLLAKLHRAPGRLTIWRRTKLMRRLHARDYW